MLPFQYAVSPLLSSHSVYEVKDLPKVNHCFEGVCFLYVGAQHADDIVIQILAANCRLRCESLSVNNHIRCNT